MERTPDAERSPRADALDDVGQHTVEVVAPWWSTSESIKYHPITPWVRSVGVDEDTMQELLRESLEEVPWGVIHDPV